MQMCHAGFKCNLGFLLLFLHLELKLFTSFLHRQVYGGLT